jgi:molybdate transport system substrate-binding protein
LVNERFYMFNKRLLYIGAVMFLVLLSVLMAGCTSSPTASPTPVVTPVEQKAITVFAAASLGDAFNDTGAAYTAKHPDVKVVFNFAGTQTLVTQVEQGASADVFASANTKYMSQLSGEGYMNNSTIANFANNSLAVIVPASNPANITSFADLAKPGAKVVIGAPSVPCGSYTLQVLDKSANTTGYGVDFENKVKTNVVSTEPDINGIVSKVALGEADAGIVYVSDVPAAMKDKVKTIPVPQEINVVAVYPIGVLSQSRDQAEAESFVQFVLSSDGKAILNGHGFKA